MKEHKGKIGVLLLVLVLALGGLGIGYAHWTDSLYVTGTVNTGDFSPEFTGDYEFFQDPEDPDIDEDCDCTCTFTDTDGDGDYDTMEATIINANTFSVYRLYSTIRNTGTVPMRIASVQITYGSPVMIAEEEPLVGTILNPDDEVMMKLSIAIGAAMADTYTFSVKITSVLWNL